LMPGIMSPPFIAATAPDPNYPLHVQLMTTRSGFSTSTGAHAEGHGNLLGPPVAGFDFADVCPQRLALDRDPNDFYQARWIEQDLRLEILVQEVGSRSVSKCEMNVTVRDRPYDLFPAPRVRATPPPTAPAEAAPQ